MKKRFTALILLMCMIIGILPAEASEDVSAEVTGMSFTDVTKEHPAYSAISYLFENGIINGKSDNVFAPEDSLTREELAKILVNAFELTETKNAPVFYDVPIGTWYAEYVQKLSASGLVQGISETEFGTGLTLTRQDLALIIKRFLDKNNIKSEHENTIIYADNLQISEYAKEAVLTISATGIMPEKTDGLWCPLEEATRAEAAQAIYKAILMKKEHVESLGRFGDISQYEPPFEPILGDRIAENMPTPFDAELWPKEEIIFEDFEDEDFGILKKYQGSGASFVESGGYEDSGCIKIVGDESRQSTMQMRWVGKPGEIQAGDWYVFSAMVKGENISGEGYYTNKMTVYNDKGTWMDETHQYQYKVDHDWTEYQQIIMVPEGVNELEPPEFYTISISGLMANVGGITYFDNFKLSKIKFEPMDTVLMTPNYKGLIKGDGGVGDISLRAYVNDANGLWNMDDFRFTAQITDEDHNVLIKSEIDTVTECMDVYFSSSSLDMGGDYRLESIITSKSTDEIIQKTEWPLHKKEADFETKIGYDEYGRVTKDGEPMIPISMFSYYFIDSPTEESRKAMDDFINADCFDYAAYAGMGWSYGYGNTPFRHELMKELYDNNIGISLATGSMNYGNIYTGEIKKRVQKQTDIRSLLTKLVNNYKDMPTLFRYYLYDEQNAVRFGNEMAWTREIIESLDFDHPVTGAIDRSLPARPGVYAKTADFLGYDPYPVTGKENQDISLVYNRIKEGRELNPNRPVFVILQAFWYSTRGDLRAPTEQEFRNMVFQALCAGACMLDGYAQADLMSLGAGEGRSYEEAWEDYTSVLREVQYLEPILLSVLPAPYYEVKGGGEWLNTMARRHEGKSYLFTVNNEASDKSAVIYLDGVKKIKGMYSKKEYEADDNGMFEIEWEGYETEVFEFEQADYKSSHAELKSFGISDAFIIDAESEEPSVIISADKSEYEYCTRISDYASLYINGEKAEKTGKLNLDGLSQIDIKVVSEDERFVTEKTYTVKRS